MPKQSFQTWMNDTKAVVTNWFQGEMVKETGGFSYPGGQPKSRAQIRDLASRRALSGLMPYDRYDEETKLYHNLDSIGFSIYCLPATGLSVADIRTLEGIFTQPYKPGTIIQITNIADPNCDHILEHWASARGRDKSSANSEIFQQLAARRTLYMREAQWKGRFPGESLLVRDMHLIISVTVPLSRGQETLSLVELDDLQRGRNAILGSLKSANMASFNLHPEQLINIVGDVFRPKLSAIEPRERVPYDPAVPIRDQFVSDESAVYTNRDSMLIQWKDYFTSVLTFSVKAFPTQWCGSSNGELLGPFFNRVKRISCPFMYSMTVVITDQTASKAMAKRKQLRATQMADSPVSKFVPQWKERKADWNFVVSCLDGGSKLLQVNYQLALLAPLGSEDEAEQSLKGIFSAIGWTIVRDRFAVMPRFMSCLPLMIGREAHSIMHKLKMFSSMLSWNVANLVPWIGEWKGNVPAGQVPLLQFIGRRGQLMFLDPFLNNKGNFNIAVAAASGAGKSFFTQDYVGALLATGGRAFVIDSGRSYENMCQLFGGSYLSFDRASKPCLNPFTTINDTSIDGIEDAERRGYKAEEATRFEDELPALKALIGAMADPDNPLTSKKKSLLGTAITQAWREKGKNATITTVGKHLDASNNEEAHDLAIMLRPYMEGGEFADYFEGEANINFDNNFIVLELDDLAAKGDLQVVVLMILMKKITETMYLSDRRMRKLCIIDEAWRLLGRGNTGTFIEEGYRTARKYGGAFMTITQGITDYYKAPAATAAYNNSDFVFLLRQKEETLQEVKAKQYITMNDFEEQLYSSVNTFGGMYSEVAIKSPEGLTVGQLCVDPFSSFMMSTKAEHVQAVRDLVNQGMTRMQAIEKVSQQ